MPRRANSGNPAMAGLRSKVSGVLGKEKKKRDIHLAVPVA
jgi:hypothetical protein